MIDLEKLENSGASVKADINILKEADSYNVNLAALESLSNEISASAYNEPQSPQEVEDTPKLWQNMDVSLSDIVERVFERSLRPFIIVSDDKIIYMNPTAMKMLEMSDLNQVVGEKFLRFVDKKDWETLSTNIGAMVTEGQSLEINLKSANNKIHATTINAIYLPDSNRFAFILMGSSLSVEEPIKKIVETASLFDELTGLPSFYLFEDRVQIAVNNEYYKDARLQKNMIAVVGVNLANFGDFKKLNLDDFVLKKIAATLLLSMKKTYTIARGLHYHYWILMTDIQTKQALELEITKIKAIFAEGVTDNFVTHDLIVNIGISLFPEPARSAKKLIEQCIEAVRLASEQKGNSLVFYNG